MVLFWIVASGIAMSVIALVGILTVAIGRAAIDALLLPLVALAAGSMIGAAVFHMIPASLESLPESRHVWPLLMLGFVTFLAVEQFLHWHASHRGSGATRPAVYLLLIGDGLHNFLDGVTIAGAFLVDLRLGATAWLAAALHEVPQELGDFAVLVHGGWSKKRALLANALSALPYLLGGVMTYSLSYAVNVAYLIPFAAGSFLYIGATDLVPEVNKETTLRSNALHLGFFLLGAAAMYGMTYLER